MPAVQPQPEEITLIRTIPVYYTDRMLADAKSFSPSAAKPQSVVESWQLQGFPIDLRVPAPVTEAQFRLAHDPDYVHDILSGTELNGFGNRSREVAASLPYTCGAMLEAAREALENGEVAVAPCSGFHHAHHAMAQGYCTFNGLVVAAQVLRAEGRARRVGILDFDQHYGNGTDEILEHRALTFVEHYTAGQHWCLPKHAREFLERIPSIVNDMRDCDVILYQAGADPHVEDPLGGWLTTEELLARDLAVFRAAQALRIPIAWNLAGGYQTPLRKVLDIHDNTMRACVQTYAHAAVDLAGVA